MTTSARDKYANDQNERQKQEVHKDRMPKRTSSPSRNLRCKAASGRSWNSPSVVCDKLLLTSAADEICSMTARTAGQDANCNSDWDAGPKQELCGENIPEKVASPNRNVPCLSALGIHICECEDDSIYCNLITCIMSPVDGRNTKSKQTSRTMVPDKKDIKENEDNIFRCSSGQKQGNLHGLSAGNKGYGQNGRASASDFGGKSALAAWAAVVSDSSCCSSMSIRGLGEIVNPKGSRTVNDRDRLPTLASHLELTGIALTQCKLRKDHGEEKDMIVPLPSGPLQGAFEASNSVLKRDFAGLKLETGNLSINEPAPYGTLHGILRCTLRDGLPNYTFLLDDYEEAVTAKIWMEDMMMGEEHGVWRYSFYSLRGESKRKGKTGWKSWRRKDKLNSTLVGKMKVSSILCSDEKQKLSVKSECILFSPRLNELATVAQANLFTQNSSSLSKAETVCCNDAACTACSFPSPSPSLVSASDGLSYMPSPVATAALWSGLRSSSQTKFTGAEIPQGSRHTTQKWSLLSGIPSIQILKERTKTVPQKVLGVTGTSTNTHLKESLPDRLILSSNQRLSELAASIIDVPLEMQDRHIMINEQHRQANITVILPSGTHGRPLCELEGPSPLINRWREGGKCDCKGWDLGCGLMVLSDSSQKAKKYGGNEGLKLQRNEGECQSQPLRLYKQDTDEDDAYFSLAPQANGLVAIDFRAPLSPLQAFAIAIATLHGKGLNVPSNAPKRIPTVGTIMQNFPDHKVLNQICRKDGDGLCIDTANLKDFLATKAVNSKYEQTPQPQDGLDIPFVKVQGRDVLHCASELALSFEYNSLFFKVRYCC